MPATLHSLTSNITVIERGWLNCNQIVLISPEMNVLIDSGYGRHADTTLALLHEVLQGQSLHWLINTHCHSDHMGGNRALRERYACRVTIPEGEVRHVVPWTEQSCWSEQMDQYAEEFVFDDTFKAGDSFEAGGCAWQAIAAPGHDMDALMYYAADPGVLVTGDALWQNGLGFVWPETDARTGRNLFIDTALATLDVIEKLAPKTIVPGHGAPFIALGPALEKARGKLQAFRQDPARNARHAAKSLFVFALLDKGEMNASDVAAYMQSVPVYGEMCVQYLACSVAQFAEVTVQELLAVKALSLENGVVRPTMRA
ncbi:MAG: MBL fold metallo-hydrolase [Betaproteobacteria bacterium]|nr:MBL fold metallo-hydrolase [Betaproteobacteria bacterium]